jgi:uncharacterized protein YbjT (DUF2867 family)
MKIVVIGGTGLIGSKLVANLDEHGQDAVAASPNTGVNTVTGEGLSEVLIDASVVVDVSNAPDWDDDAVMRFFQTSSRNLLAAEAAAGVGHHVALSVVGTDRLQESGYFRAKLAQEELIEGSPVPYTIVHATQFFEFMNGIADEATDGNTVRLPPALIQPMAADDVASALARVAVGPPLNRIVEIAGPDQFPLDELIRGVLASRHDPRAVIADPNARYYGIAPSERTLLPGDDARLGATHSTIGSKRPRPRARARIPNRAPGPARREIRVSTARLRRPTTDFPSVGRRRADRYPERTSNRQTIRKGTR